MKTIREMADEHARYPGAEYVTEMMIVRRIAYLAGAKAALEMAAHKAAQKTAMFPSDSDYTRGYAIARSDVCDEIRALIPTES